MREGFSQAKGLRAERLLPGVLLCGAHLAARSNIGAGKKCVNILRTEALVILALSKSFPKIFRNTALGRIPTDSSSLNRAPCLRPMSTVYEVAGGSDDERPPERDRKSGQ